MTARRIEVLIVEDNPDDLELALRALERHNLVNHVTVARDGAEALDIIFGNAPADQRPPTDVPWLILLDLKLPKVDGLEVLRQVKSDPRTSSIPVVILTSSDEERDMVESYRLGVNSYLRKPVNFDKFVEIVRHFGLYWLLLNEMPPNNLI